MQPELTWQSFAEEGKHKLEKSFSILTHKIELSFPTPDTMADYAAMKQAKQAVKAALDALKPIEKFLP